MRSATRCLLLAGMTLAVVPSCFLQLRAHRGQITRHARGGEEVDIKVKGETAQLTEEPKSSGVDLLGLVLGGVVGLAVAAGKAVESFLNKKVINVWHPSQEPGAAEPVGFFDPLKLATTEEKFRQFRIAEIKHGRVAMMAAAGAVVQHYVKLPFLKDVPSGLAALQTTQGQIGAAALFLACGYVETKLWTQAEDKEPGNFGDPANWAQTGLGGGTYSVENRERELFNGRFAMTPFSSCPSSQPPRPPRPSLHPWWRLLPRWLMPPHRWRRMWRSWRSESH